MDIESENATLKRDCFARIVDALQVASTHHRYNKYTEQHMHTHMHTGLLTMDYSLAVCYMYYLPI